MQGGVIDAVQSDDAAMASPVDINVFGGYFPFSTRYSLDLPVLFKYYGLNEIWAEAYGEVKNVEWLGAGAWDPLHIFTKEPIRSLADMKGKRVFGASTLLQQASYPRSRVFHIQSVRLTWRSLSPVSRPCPGAVLPFPVSRS